MYVCYHLTGKLLVALTVANFCWRDPVQYPAFQSAAVCLFASVFHCCQFASSLSLHLLCIPAVCLNAWIYYHQLTNKYNFPSPLCIQEKRANFPRFYFIGDDDLLEILGQSTNPTVIQTHLKKLFAGIHSVDFDENNQHIVAMKSLDGEVVPLKHKVQIVEQVEVRTSLAWMVVGFCVCFVCVLFCYVLCVCFAEMLTGLRISFLIKSRPVYHSIVHLKEREVEKQSDHCSTLRGRK